MSSRSMTGFARVRAALPDGEMIVSLKSVNHRGLDLHFHMPSELDPHEPALRNLLKSKIARGHVQVHVQISRAAAAAGGSFNHELMQTWLDAFRAAASQFQLESKPDLNAALRIPGMLSASSIETVPEMETLLVGAVEEAAKILNISRNEEGATIETELRERCARIEEQAEKMEAIREHAAPAFHKRLQEKLGELLRGAAIDPQRLAQEAALLADRSDVSEELLRLKTHAAQLGSLLDASGEKGKKLDFLLQEMNREANTILSKTGGLGDLGLTMTELALAAKSEIDKIREQSLNLE